MKIGNRELEIPVIQGGMGVGVSLSGLAGHVAAFGGVGIISTAQIGFRRPGFSKNPILCNLETIKEEVKKAKDIAGGHGMVGVNIMVVTREYEDYVKAAVDAGADIIISGAGLPMDLPRIIGDKSVLIAPVISSKRALRVILQYWKKHYQKTPDLVVVEGPMAGGHLGFNREELEEYKKNSFDGQLQEILELTEKTGIPVVMAGGVYKREDMMHYMSMGACGVQMATRFVTTYECDADIRYKQAYIDAEKDDIVIVDSPVGMPGRAINNRFLERVRQGERFMKGCRKCITTCDPATTPYCITQALIQAVTGNVDEGLFFCGSNAYRATKLEHVSDIMEEFRV